MTNSHTQETIEGCARAAGAVVECELGCGHLVNAADEAATHRTFALVTNAWKAPDPGFRSMTRDQVIAATDQYLESVPERCPRC